jgi:acetyl esterase/lipase
MSVLKTIQMKETTIQLTILSAMLLSSCSTNEQIAATYKVMKDVSYGADTEQTMDIYLSKEAKSYGKSNYTVVFLHGGGYYLSDKSQEERYIEPYLKKGLNVVNMNYRLKKGIPIATTDLTNALNFLITNNNDYNLNFGNVILTGFSAGAHIATNVGVSRNNPEYPNKLNDGIAVTGIINFSGPVDGLDIVERLFSDSDIDIMSEIGKALFPLTASYESKEVMAAYEPVTYLNKNDPPIFIWHGGKDNQVPPATFERFVPMLKTTTKKNLVIFAPDGNHSPNPEELQNAYKEIFVFLDNLKR